MVISDAVARVLRTLVQLIAAGALTALVEQSARDLPSNYTPYILMFWTVVVMVGYVFQLTCAREPSGPGRL